MLFGIRTSQTCCLTTTTFSSFFSHHSVVSKEDTCILYMYTVVHIVVVLSRLGLDSSFLFNIIKAGTCFSLCVCERIRCLSLYFPIFRFIPRRHGFLYIQMGECLVVLCYVGLIKYGRPLDIFGLLKHFLTLSVWLPSAFRCLYVVIKSYDRKKNENR